MTEGLMRNPDSTGIIVSGPSGSAAEPRACAARVIQFPRHEEIGQLGTAVLRERFIAEGLFEPGEIRVVYTDLDRMVIGGAAPGAPLQLLSYAELGSSYFTERREIGVVNIGGRGIIRAGGIEHALDFMDCLYIGRGVEEVIFMRAGGGAPLFYFLSCPAHQTYPTVKVARAESQSEAIGDAANASRRVIHKYIHPGGARSCQLVMGLTVLEPNSVWNTMPPHLHSRRTEAYLYFGLGEGVVVHLMGRPESTRSLIVRDREAVLSPSWSIHCAAGTQPYKFVWGMAGENQDFGDIAPISLKDLM
jgi:4-deoxy-L-threo-5-hexosulose-uronate ketol-isomerase